MNNVDKENKTSQLLNLHQQLLSEIKAKGKSNIWESYKSKKIKSSNYVIFEQQDIINLDTMKGLKLPSEICYFYTEIGCSANDLTNKLKCIIEERCDRIDYEFAMSEEFAQIILKKYFSLTTEERQRLTDKIADYDTHNFVSQYTSEIEYLLIESASHFSVEEDKFKFSFLQQLYEVNYHSNLIIKSLLIWAHCGGCGTLLLNTDRKGFDSGAMWGYFLTTKFNETDYKYHSNFHRDNEKHHCQQYTQIIEEDIKFMQSHLTSFITQLLNLIN